MLGAVIVVQASSTRSLLVVFVRKKDGKPHFSSTTFSASDNRTKSIPKIGEIFTR